MGSHKRFHCPDRDAILVFIMRASLVAIAGIVATGIAAIIIYAPG